MKSIPGGKTKRSIASRSVSFHSGDASDNVATSTFGIPAQDSKGNSERMPPVRVPPAMLRQIDVIRNLPNLKFKTQSDVIRACIHEGLKVITKATADPALSNMQSIINNWVRACQTEEEFSNYSQTIDQITGTVNKLVGMGAGDRAAGLIRGMLKDLKGMDDEFWRGRYEMELQSRFGHLNSYKVAKKAEKEEGEGEEE